jgi:hypothetical protein
MSLTKFLGCSCLMLNRESATPISHGGVCLFIFYLFIFTMYLTLFVAQHASFIAYFAWGRAIIWMIIWCRSLSQEKKNIYFSFILF